MIKSRFKLFFAAMFFLALAIPSFSFAVERDLADIFEAIEAQGADEAGVAELKAYIESYPYSVGTDEALSRLGGIYLGKKEFDNAFRAYQRIIADFPDGRFYMEAIYRAGYIKYRKGELIEAKSILDQLAFNSGVPFGVKAKARIVLKDINYALEGVSGENDSKAIGVLLPLEGNYAKFGEDALNGVLLAAEVFGGKKGPVEVIVKNVGVNPADASRAVAELSEDERVSGLIGPLLSATATEAANAAQDNRIPIITLSQKDGVTGAGEYVFRNFLTPASQASALALYSINVRGFKNFAVLYPNNNYGTELAKLFEKEIKKNGGNIVSEVSYQQGNTNFSEEMKKAFGVQVKERKEGRRKIKEYTPTIKADAIFIPDFYEPVSMILPYLEYYNIKGVQLLGANGWNSQKLIESSAKAVEGAVFVDGYFEKSSMTESADFSRRFREVYGKEPGILEAQAYDSAMILISAIMEDVGAGRDGVKDRIAAISFKGAAGETAFDAKRESVKKLFILTVANGKITEAARE